MEATMLPLTLADLGKRDYPTLIIPSGAFPGDWEQRPLPGVHLVISTPDGQTKVMEINHPVVARMLEDCLKTFAAKGADYTAGTDDPLWNFREGATVLEIPMIKVWGVYFWKHFSAILKFIRTGRVESEPIKGRVMDAIVYLFNLALILEDPEGQAEAQEPEDGEDDETEVVPAR